MMTREEWQTLIATLIAAGQLQPEDADPLLEAFDAGLLPEMIPLPPYFDERPEEEDEDRRWYWIVVLIAAGSLLRFRRRLSDRDRRRARDRLRVIFEQDVDMAAAAVYATGNVQQWQRSMTAAIARYTAGMAQAGAGQQIANATTRSIIDRMIRAQQPYLSRFAGQIGARRILQNPMSYAQIAARSRMYGGDGWAAYFMGNEIDTRAGFVVQYIAQDDLNTCDPCLRYHHRYFLPGTGIYPGQVCQGRGLCRCERVTVYRPDIYEMLQGIRNIEGGIAADEIARFAA